MNDRDQRIENLVALSTSVYKALTPAHSQTEAPARTILRTGMQIVARTLLDTQDYDAAGAAYYSYLYTALEQLGVPTNIYEPWQLPMIDNTAPHADTIYFPDIDTLAQKYADIDRGTRTVDGIAETNAMHVVHVTALLIPYAATMYPALDIIKLSLYALLHDAVEAYAGDTVTIYMDAMLEQTKHDKEVAALRRISQELSGAHPLFVQLIEDYEQLADDEARCTKVFDKLDPSFSHALNRGMALLHDHGIDTPEELRSTIAHSNARMALYNASFSELMLDRAALVEYCIRSIDWK